MNPQQLTLTVAFNLPTRNPADPQVGLDIRAEIDVIIHWSEDRAELAKEKVEFADPLWLGPGGGPFTIYDPGLNGALAPVAVVELSVVTTTLFRKETANGRIRWVITPVAKLVTKETPRNGGAPNIQIAYTASNPVNGDWK